MTSCFRPLFSFVARCHSARLTSPRLLAAALFACSFFAPVAFAQTVIEYYNEALDAHFLTGRATEQASLDATASFMRTGMSFSAASALAAPAGTSSICRFYIAVDNPFTRSHFYGVKGIDCERLVAAPPPGFSFEGYDFAVTRAVGGGCAANSTPIYRGFRSGSGQRTSNHRYTASAATYQASIAAGYVGEGVVFCAASATPASSVVLVTTPTCQNGMLPSQMPCKIGNVIVNGLGLTSYGTSFCSPSISVTNTDTERTNSGSVSFDVTTPLGAQTVQFGIGYIGRSATTTQSGDLAYGGACAQMTFQLNRLHSTFNFASIAATPACQTGMLPAQLPCKIGHVIVNGLGLTSYATSFCSPSISVSNTDTVNTNSGSVSFDVTTPLGAQTVQFGIGYIGRSATATQSGDLAYGGACAQMSFRLNRGQSFFN